MNPLSQVRKLLKRLSWSALCFRNVKRRLDTGNLIVEAPVVNNE